ncbi:coiled-coil domain-containing protein [Anthocerotibacter panamensis]|uniref:hypothetical protein n=1 Tax=Anthocerotibacter panamensis TaxID=2857077 RepID=UPI001C40796C|nr:hypothetical protein [Anthocerotibacter panamensis]
MPATESQSALPIERYISLAQETLGQLLDHLRTRLPEERDLADQAQAQLALLLGRFSQDLPFVGTQHLWDLRERLHAAQAQIAALTEALSQNQSTLTSLEDRRTGDLDRVAVLQEEVQATREELLKSIEREQQLQRDLQTLEAVPAHLEQQLVETQAVAILHEEQIDTAQGQIASLKEQLAQIYSRNAALEEQLALAQSQSARLEEQDVTVQSQNLALVALEEQLSAAHGRILSLEEQRTAESAALQEQLTTTQAQILSLEEQNLTLQSQHTALQDLLRHASTDHEAELMQAQVHIQALEAELLAQRSADPEPITTLPAVERSLDLFLADLNRKLADLEARQTLFTHLEERLQLLEQQQNDYQHLQEEVDQLKKWATEEAKLKQTTVRTLLEEAGLDLDILE